MLRSAPLLFFALALLISFVSAARRDRWARPANIARNIVVHQRPIGARMTAPTIIASAPKLPASDASNAPILPPGPLLDNARLFFTVEPSGASRNISVYGVSSVCYECYPQFLNSNVTGTSTWADVTSDFTFTLVVTAVVHDVPVETTFTHWFGDRGEYDITATFNIAPPNSSLYTQSVRIASVVDPQSTALPLIVAVLILLALNFIIRFAAHVHERRKLDHHGSSEHSMPLLSANVDTEGGVSKAAVGTAAVDAVAAKGQSVAGSSKRVRLESLDTFRGMSLAVMILANSNGGFYWFLNHSYWNGVTVADLVFPWFIFMMGVSIAIVLRSDKKKNVSKSEVMLRSIKRGAILFYLGLFDAMNNNGDAGTDFSQLRIPGVLQRFGVSYIVVVSLAYLLPPNEETEIGDGELDGDDGGFTSSIATTFKDALYQIWRYKYQWACIVSMQAIWFLITFLMPFPGCPTGYLGPGGIGSYGKYQNCTGGVATYIDSKVLGQTHLFKWFGGQFDSEKATYKPVVYHDPEGILGYVNSFALVYFGLVGGRIMMRHSGDFKRTMRLLFLFGSVLCLLTGGFCGFSQNGGFVPVNKNLWTPTFVWLMGGFAMWNLCWLHYVVDVKKWWDGSPFKFMGMNSIIVYMGSETMYDRFPFSFDVPELSHSWELFSNLLGIASWMVVAYVLHVKKMYFSV